MNDMVTVIIPAYNVGEYIKKSVSSVIRQTWRNLQIIIVDDGSTDSTPEICAQLKYRDSRIEVIHKTNGGVSSARNAALPFIRGAYVTFMDADDELYEDCIEKMMDALRRLNADAVQCVMVIDRQEHQKTVEEIVFSGKSVLYEVLTLGEVNTYLCGKLFRTELLDGLHFAEQLTTGEDFVYMYQALKHCQTFAVIKNKGYHYVWRDDACTKSKPRPSFFLTLNELERLRAQETSPGIKTAWGVYISSFATFLLVRAVQTDCFPEWYPRLRKASVAYFWKPHPGYRTPNKRRIHLLLLTICPHLYYKKLKKQI